MNILKQLFTSGSVNIVESPRFRLRDYLTILTERSEKNSKLLP